MRRWQYAIVLMGLFPALGLVGTLLATPVTNHLAETGRIGSDSGAAFIAAVMGGVGFAMAAIVLLWTAYKLFELRRCG